MAQSASIIPQPEKITERKGFFLLSEKTVIIVPNSADRPSADFLNEYLKKFYGFSLKIQQLAQKNYIRISTRVFIKAPDNEERYTLEASANGIEIQGDSYRGSFYGIQTLLQLLPPDAARFSTKKNKVRPAIPIAAIAIEDQPRFAYRGMHLDVSRHFFDVAYIKKYIDFLALHKLNTFHWHLTDDQGWRIEIKKYPKLTAVGGWRNGTIIGRYPGKGNDSIHYGGFYTQDEVKEVVQYAASRFITVIPEIEMPGHASAAIAAYPQLSCFPEEDTKVAKGTAWAGTTRGKQVQQAWGVFDDVFCAGKESTFELLQDVLDEVLPLFPSKYIHVGGDECPKANWKRCPQCQQRIKDNGLKDEHELQSYFIRRIEKYINSKGKQIIGWDEILEGGLAPNASVMSWRGEQGGIDAARQNHDVVMTPGGWCYFDHSQSRNEDSVTIGGYTPVEKVYGYDPVPAVLSNTEAKHILGVQANLWTEYIGNTAKIEYQLFPRLAALSEIQWTSKERKDSAGFERRLETQFRRYDLWKINYSRAFYSIQGTVEPTGNGTVKLSLASKAKGAMLAFSTAPQQHRMYTGTLELGYSRMITAMLIKHYVDRSHILSTTDFLFEFNKATGRKISVTPAPSSSYPGNGGAMGLVNGIRANKFASPEWLGWSGKVPEITVELGKRDSIREVVLHVWRQEPSWIWLPEKVEITIIDQSDHIRPSKTLTIVQPAGGWPDDRALHFRFDKTMATKLLVRVTPVMKIPEGNAGAGNAAWIFLDEIEIN